MNALVDKAQVEKQFSRAAQSYNSAASLQRTMSEQLIDMLVAQPQCNQISSITDLGCGTGESLLQLSQHYPKAALTAVDISAAMLERARLCLDSAPCATRAQAQYICADMDQYQSASAQDLVFANASIQWCDLDKVLARTYPALNDRGLLAFSSFGPNTHIELRDAWRQVDDDTHRIDFLSASEHVEALQRAGFNILGQRQCIERLPFDNPQQLLSSIKRTGATNASKDRATGLLSRERYNAFVTQLEQNQPLQLSYEVLSFVAEKNTDMSPLVRPLVRSC